MKKTFPLQHPSKAPARVVESVKHEVRKYVKREHNKPLAEGATRTYVCRVGAAADSALECPLDDVGTRIDQVVAEGSSEVYVEVVATVTAPPADSESSGAE